MCTITPPGFTSAGVLAYGPDDIAWYGVRAGVTRVLTGALDRGQPALQLAPEIDVPDFPGADVGAIGGAQGDWLFLARVAPELSTTPRDVVQVVSLGARTVLPPVTAPGPVTAMAGLPQGRVLIGYTRSNGGPGLAVIEPGPNRVEAVHPLSLPEGLTVRVLQPDPDSCDAIAPSA